MNMIAYYVLKLALSAVLLFVIAFAVRELHSLWCVRRIALAPFAYNKDGAANAELGKSFSQRVYQDMRRLEGIMEGIDIAPAFDDAPSTTTLELVSVAPPAIGAFDVPEFRELPLAGVEIKVQGVDLTSIIRSLHQFVNPPEEFTGSVTEANGKFATLVEWRRAVHRPDDQGHLSSTDHSTAASASFSAACGIIYALLDSRDGMRDKIAQSEFEAFAGAMSDYAAYRRAVSNLRREKMTDEDQKLLVEADRVASVLVNRGVGKRFPPVTLLGAITAAASNDVARANELLASYKRQNPGDKAAKDLEGRLAKIPQASPQALEVAKVIHATGAAAIAKPGSSIGTNSTSGGTSCCIVESRKDPTKKYLVTAGYLFGDDAPGQAVFQPALVDGGTLSGSRIGTLAARKDQVAALVALDPTAAIDLDCPGFGPFRGTAEAEIGQIVYLIGRTSGKSAGKVVEVKVNTSMLSGAVACIGLEGGDFSQSGDGGAPVVDKDGRLLGMHHSRSEDRELSLFVPIKTIWNAFDVQLVGVPGAAAAPGVQPQAVAVPDS